MKKLILIIAVLFSFGASAQSTHYEDFALDTITNAGTIYFTVAETFMNAGQYGFYIVADSLSGATDATVSFQVAPIGSSNWTTVASSTINGVQTIIAREARLYGNKIRAKCTGTGTQSTKCKATFVWFKDE